jgi:phenylalanyl-tRNA synthetase beta chain
LRTDAASRFEKGTDISGTVVALKRAATLIKEICGGEIASEIVDVYPNPKEKVQVGIKYHYLKKLSGKNYHQDTVNDILVSLGFEIVKRGIDELRVAVPYHKPDITLAADLVEEILRIDGLDNVDIPGAITITPAVEDNYALEAFEEKTANYLVGLGFYEIMTNSITNSAYFSDDELKFAVKMLNNLSAELNILRPSMLETGLEAIAHNLNRKSSELRLFEFGKTYTTSGPGKYKEPQHLCLYLTGKNLEDGWKTKSTASDFYVLKGIVSKVLQQLGVNIDQFERLNDPCFEDGLQGKIKESVVVQSGIVRKKILARFDIKQPVFFADLNWDVLATLAAANKPAFNVIPKFPSVQRDLSLVIPSRLAYEEIEKSVKALKLNKLQGVRLFDVFESEKLGAGKKSVAINFTFLDEEKTLTDQEIDGWMKAIMTSLEKNLQAEIRK